ncbi:hypothetical protein MMC12_006842 [Toensbergia leucococca]|nr:hypothetical protein [Toensbergia leucococca]
MGICASCLGLGRQKQDAENPETSRLLYDDPYRSRYGSTVQNGMRPVVQPDPEFLRREREALEGIAHVMSDHVIDVFTALPSDIDAERQDDSTEEEPHLNGSETNGILPEEIQYKSVRRGKVGAIASAVGGGSGDWKAAKAAMG